jgi:hypothetical protein
MTVQDRRGALKFRNHLNLVQPTETKKYDLRHRLLIHGSGFKAEPTRKEPNEAKVFHSLLDHGPVVVGPGILDLRAINP